MKTGSMRSRKGAAIAGFNQYIVGTSLEAGANRIRSRPTAQG
jgi:hypothetical protein